jgi:predicted RNA-binding protein
VQSRKRFPKEGRILVTSIGEEKVLANDIFGDRVTLRGPEGDTRVVPLAELKQELEQRASMVEEHEEEPPTPEPATETVLEDEAPVRTTASTIAGPPRTLTPLPGETPATDATDRRPHRRRGRRGGRRGRSGGESPPAAPEGE